MGISQYAANASPSHGGKAKVEKERLTIITSDDHHPPPKTAHLCGLLQFLLNPSNDADNLPCRPDRFPSLRGHSKDAQKHYRVRHLRSLLSTEQ
jgi:hypothetical protein